MALTYQIIMPKMRYAFKPFKIPHIYEMLNHISWDLKKTWVNNVYVTSNDM